MRKFSYIWILFTFVAEPGLTQQASDVNTDFSWLQEEVDTMRSIPKVQKLDVNLAQYAEDASRARNIIEPERIRLEVDNDMDEMVRVAFDRAGHAMAKTEEGKKRLESCVYRDTGIWAGCFVTGWPYAHIFNELRQEFYEEELESYRENNENKLQESMRKIIGLVGDGSIFGLEPQ